MFDEELAGMVNYSDDTVPQEMPVMEVKPRPVNTEPIAEKRVNRVAEDCGECPYFKKKRSTIDKLYDMTKWLGVCGCISMLMWWFWQNGMMDMEAAFPCILLSGCIGTFGAGWSVK